MFKYIKKTLQYSKSTNSRLDEIQLLMRRPQTLSRTEAVTVRSEASPPMIQVANKGLFNFDDILQENQPDVDLKNTKGK